MSGHNKWSKIKHKKIILDSKRSKIWTKAIKEISYTSKMFGQNLETNYKLKKAIYEAKLINIPKNTINKAIKKNLKNNNTNYEKLNYEGYDPNGVAILIECITNNRNRTFSNIKKNFNKLKCKISKNSLTQYNFQKKQKLIFKKNKYPLLTEDILLEYGLDFGIEDIKTKNDSLIIICDLSNSKILQKKLHINNLTANIIKISTIPNRIVHLSHDKAKTLLNLISLLKSLDDVTRIWHNMNIVDS